MRQSMAAVFALAALIVVPAHARAQDGGDQAKPPATQKPTATARKPTPKLPIAYRAFFVAEITALSASETFEAVSGSSVMNSLGGGGEVLNLWRKAFARVAVTSGSQTGSRGYFIGGEQLPVEIPVEVRITNFELGGGWRQYLKKHPNIAFYGGGGLVIANYRESSDFAEAGEDSALAFNGYSVFGGVEVAIWKWVIGGVEGHYRSVPDALGETGLSNAYGDSNLGGASIRVLIGVRYKR
jgi:hypothetical protein